MYSLIDGYSSSINDIQVSFVLSVWDEEMNSILEKNRKEAKSFVRNL